MSIMQASFVALISSLILTVIFLPLLIKFMHSHHEGQEIRDEGPNGTKRNQELLQWEEQFLLLQQ